MVTDSSKGYFDSNTRFSCDPEVLVVEAVHRIHELRPLPPREKVVQPVVALVGANW